MTINLRSATLDDMEPLLVAAEERAAEIGVTLTDDALCIYRTLCDLYELGYRSIGYCRRLELMLTN